MFVFSCHIVINYFPVIPIVPDSVFFSYEIYLLYLKNLSNYKSAISLSYTNPQMSFMINKVPKNIIYYFCLPFYLTFLIVNWSYIQIQKLLICYNMQVIILFNINNEIK